MTDSLSLSLTLYLDSSWLSEDSWLLEPIGSNSSWCSLLYLLMFKRLSWMRYPSSSPWCWSCDNDALWDGSELTLMEANIIMCSEKTNFSSLIECLHGILCNGTWCLWACVAEDSIYGAVLVNRPPELHTWSHSLIVKSSSTQVLRNWLSLLVTERALYAWFFHGQTMVLEMRKRLNMA